METSRNHYHNLATTTDPELRQMALQLGQGPASLRGVVVPKATAYGIPRGTRPHDTKDVVVHIDPHLGEDIRVRLGDITAAAVDRATHEVEQYTEEPYDMDSFRTRGAAIMRSMANFPDLTKTAEVPPPQQSPPPQYSPAPVQQYPPAYTAQPYTQPQPQPLQQPDPNARRVSPLSALNQMQAAPPQQQAVAAVPQPNIKCIFELENFGSHEAWYHEVLIDTGFAVLVYNNDCVHGSKYFPRMTTENQVRMAMMVEGTHEVHQIQTTGVEFTHGPYEYCVLMIEQTVPAP